MTEEFFNHQSIDLSASVRQAILIKVYSYILALPDRRNNENEPTPPDLGREEVVSSPTDVPADADANSPIESGNDSPM